MVFQKPNPSDNVHLRQRRCSLRLTGAKKGKNLDEVVRRSLEQATLWDEVKDDLRSRAPASPAASSSDSASPARLRAA